MQLGIRKKKERNLTTLTAESVCIHGNAYTPLMGVTQNNHFGKQLVACNPEISLFIYTTEQWSSNFISHRNHLEGL